MLQRGLRQLLPQRAKSESDEAERPAGSSAGAGAARPRPSQASHLQPNVYLQASPTTPSSSDEDRRTRVPRLRSPQRPKGGRPANASEGPQDPRGTKRPLAADEEVEPDSLDEAKAASAEADQLLEDAETAYERAKAARHKADLLLLEHSANAGRSAGSDRGGTADAEPPAKAEPEPAQADDYQVEESPPPSPRPRKKVLWLQSCAFWR